MFPSNYFLPEYKHLHGYNIYNLHYFFIQNYFVTIVPCHCTTFIFNNCSIVLYGQWMIVWRNSKKYNQPKCKPWERHRNPLSLCFSSVKWGWMYVKHIVLCLTLDKHWLWFMTQCEPYELAFVIGCFEIFVALFMSSSQTMGKFL